MHLDEITFTRIVPWLAAGGVGVIGWFLVRTLNQIDKRLGGLAGKLEAMRGEVNEQGERLARIEGRLDAKGDRR